jgi:hypothetical protein
MRISAISYGPCPNRTTGVLRCDRTGSGASRSSLHLNLFNGVVDAMLRIVSSLMRARFRIAFSGALVEERVHRTNIQRMPPRLDNQVNDVAVSRRSAIRDRPGRPASDAFFNPERWNRNRFPFRTAAFFTRRTYEPRIHRVHWSYRRGGNCDHWRLRSGLTVPLLPSTQPPLRFFCPAAATGRTSSSVMPVLG